ncbi:hypothetical protein M9H77_03510 [Catharanthus roseus]|uniref:Uncharacterized protein n=1 Tax=Catharanthus roseus TaxID=4058 RepID=A0ACC0CBF0_CATRO|nr:hypothetical protein M9H77_03510 [Catharanthus roseus]
MNRLCPEEGVHETRKTRKDVKCGGDICNVPDPLGSDWEAGVKPKLKEGISKFGLSNGSIIGCPASDPSPLSTSACPGSICSCLSGKGGTRGRLPPAPQPGCLRAPLLTLRALRSDTCSRGWRHDGCTGNVCWISCCDGVQPKVSSIETMHLRIIVCTFFANTAICEGSVSGFYITTKAISSTSCNMEV